MGSSVLLETAKYGSVIFLNEERFSHISESKYNETVEKLKRDGKLRMVTDDLWRGWTGIKECEIDFSFDEIAYRKHFFNFTSISEKKIKKMMKYYFVMNVDAFIYKGLDTKLDVLKQVITGIGEPGLTISHDHFMWICDFLIFIEIPVKKRTAITNRINFISKHKKTKARVLAPMINYLAIQSEIDRLFSENITDAEYVRWFPVYFWVDLTFILPLRATEMLVTPFDCIENKDGIVKIKVRRTMLKKGRRKVFHEVEKDYKIFSYTIPSVSLIEKIEKYQQLTAGHNRKYLFDYGKYSINEFFSLRSFNELLFEFVDEYLIGNSKYDYSRFASGIEEFEHVTAGDSRPIAMANLYFQNFGANVCRELADHENLETSYLYYENVSQTIEQSAIIRLQKKINLRREDEGQMEMELAKMRQMKEHSGVDKARIKVAEGVYCTDERRIIDPQDITTCRQQHRLKKCIGCTKCEPTEEYIEKEIKKSRKETDKWIKKAFEYLNDTKRALQRNEDMDEIALHAGTFIRRLAEVSDAMAEEKLEKWERRKIIQTRF